jgi:hypothetical protein
MVRSDGLQSRLKILERYSATRRKPNAMKEFAASLSQMHLSRQERATIVARQYVMAAQLCLDRGELPTAKKLLCRGYLVAARHHDSRIAMLAASMRVSIERIQRNARGMRLWTQRHEHWKARVTLSESTRNSFRKMYREHVVGLIEPQVPRYYNDYICDELRHVIVPYQHCSRGEYSRALQALDVLAIHQSRSIYLANEVCWLRFRICLSEQRYTEAASVYRQMKAAKMGTPRMHECRLLAQTMLELVSNLYSQHDDPVVFRYRLTSTVNSFEVLRNERTGLYFSVLIYEIVRLLLEHKYDKASSRLAAFRVRLQRCKPFALYEELHLMLKVVGYILATCHRLKRPFPAVIMQEFRLVGQDVPYIQQGLISYSELAYRLLRRLGYR